MSRAEPVGGDSVVDHVHGEQLERSNGGACNTRIGAATWATMEVQVAVYATKVTSAGMEVAFGCSSNAR
jgi:hypothetical protein